MGKRSFTGYSKRKPSEYWINIPVAPVWELLTAPRIIGLFYKLYTL
jgi:hypothetical protein